MVRTLNLASRSLCADYLDGNDNADDQQVVITTLLFPHAVAIGTFEKMALVEMLYAPDLLAQLTEIVDIAKAAHDNSQCFLDARDLLNEIKSKKG